MSSQDLRPISGCRGHGLVTVSKSRRVQMTMRSPEEFCNRVTVSEEEARRGPSSSGVQHVKGCRCPRCGRNKG